MEFWSYMLIFIIGSYIFSYVYEKKRTEAFELIAKSLGFSFSKSGRETTKSMYGNFELFSKGHHGNLKNEIWGNNKNNRVSIFGYSYNSQRNNSGYSHTYIQTVLSIEDSKLNFPKFELEPENIFHKIGQVFGYQDIDFESFPVFSKKYLLRGRDEVKIRELFTPKVIKYFEMNQNIHIEAQGHILIFYKPSKECKINEIKEFYREGQVALSNFI
ncbi:MAG: hypothetical protein D3903_21820 [Candidatus Electrothrix sp. GM3_4]|nr:hypothetical protein [Candidatus Electrothrix sp. GM3_4]